MVTDNDPIGREHGPVVLDLLQNMTFPELSREPMIDSIIKKCWYGEYRTIVELARSHGCRWLFIISRAMERRHVCWGLLRAWGVAFEGMLLPWREPLPQLSTRTPSAPLALWSWKAVCLRGVKLRLLMMPDQCSNNLFFCESTQHRTCLRSSPRRGSAILFGVLTKSKTEWRSGWSEMLILPR